MAGKQVTDRRIQKTQKLLRDALTSLIHEKDYDSIVVKEILDRANVGRSTFYMHFNDKDELLASGIHEMLHALKPAALPASAKRYEKLIWFSLPIFEFHEQRRHGGGARIGPKGRAVLHGHLQQVLAALIADDVRKDLQGKKRTVFKTSPDILAQYVASTFILVLDWWGEGGRKLPVAEINALFRALVLPTLAAIWE